MAGAGGCFVRLSQSLNITVIGILDFIGCNHIVITNIPPLGMLNMKFSVAHHTPLSLLLAGGHDINLTARVKLLCRRSEEHTLNSSHSQISYAVFCLKKK